ncbi:C-C motif chemokine 27-like [Saccopteryx leptura]|uniref:C-C motif chemokine 27-like n=1 Tax=Saccopteryx leptura TaxID=249018 RepID=UPI00339BCADE
MSNTFSLASDSPVSPVKSHQTPGQGKGEERRRTGLSTTSLLLLRLQIHDPGAAGLLPLSATCGAHSIAATPEQLRRKVTRVGLQEADGDSHLQAFVLYLSGCSICRRPPEPQARWFGHRGGCSRALSPS